MSDKLEPLAYFKIPPPSISILIGINQFSEDEILKTGGVVVWMSYNYKGIGN
jgi:hypothetical protein